MNTPIEYTRSLCRWAIVVLRLKSMLSWLSDESELASLESASLCFRGSCSVVGSSRGVSAFDFSSRFSLRVSWSVSVSDSLYKLCVKYSLLLRTLLLSRSLPLLLGFTW